MINSQCQKADFIPINSSYYSYHQYGSSDAQLWHLNNCHNCDLQMVLYSTLLLHAGSIWHNKLTNVWGFPCKKPCIIIFISLVLSWSQLFKSLNNKSCFLEILSRVNLFDFYRICIISYIIYLKRLNINSNKTCKFIWNVFKFNSKFS